MNGFATIVSVYQSPESGESIGQARIIEVLKYISKGWYLIKCALLDSPSDAVELYTNIEK